MKRSELKAGIQDSIDWREFEKLWAIVLAIAGFEKVWVTPPRGDGGIDVIGQKKNHSDQTVLCLSQVKHNSEENNVGISAIDRDWYRDGRVQAAILAAHKKADIVDISWVTASDYWDNASQFAKQKCIEAYNIDTLIDYVDMILEREENTNFTRSDLFYFLNHNEGLFKEIDSIQEVLTMNEVMLCEVNNNGQVVPGQKHSGRKVSIWLPGQIQLQEDVVIGEDGRIDIGREYKRIETDSDVYNIEVILEFTGYRPTPWDI